MPSPSLAPTIDVFTLDTGRLFPEVLETVELSEIRYGLRIRAGHAGRREVEALVARDGVFGFRHVGREPQGLLRGAQGPPAEPRAERRRKAGSPALRREHSDERARRRACRLGRGATG